MDFHILGPIEATAGEHPVALGGFKQRALLGMLVLHAGEAVSTDRLIDELWPGERRDEALKTLQVTVSRLRRALEPDRPPGVDSDLLVTRPRGYELRVAPERVDAGRFEALLEAGRRALATGDARAARAMLDEALALWRGPPLADLAYESFCQAEVARLEELHAAALEERIAADLALGRHAELVAELRALARRHPLRERLHGQLMLALYRSGRQADALDVFAQARRELVDELGIEPGRELRELHQAVLQQDPGLDLPAPPEAPPDAAGSLFVGREPELAALLAGLGDVAAGRGRLFLLGGEPGIGKSRLAEELLRHADRHGARVLVGRCWEAGGAPAYWPWVQSLRTFVRESDAAAVRALLPAGCTELARIVPELRPYVGEPPAGEAPDAEGARFRLFDATAQFLREAARSRPIVLVLDDLHAADVPSLLMLRFLARELASARLLVVGAYRNVAPVPGKALTEMLAEVCREPVTRRLELGGLSAGEVAEYVELTASQIASSALAAALHEDTEGNPLFFGEILRLVAAEGAGTRAGAGAPFAIPQSIRDVIARRLGHLSDGCRRMLTLASVIGREFAVATLTRSAGIAEDEVLDALDEAVEARIVSDVPGGNVRLRFAHVLIRDTLYEGLTHARRIRLHRRVLEALEALCGDEPGAHLAELAHHAVAARDPGKGRAYAARAGDRAQELLAYEEAVRLYELALDALDQEQPADERVRCELLLSLGGARARAGAAQAAKRAFHEAARIARRLGAPRELARAAAGYGGRFMWARAGGDELLRPLLEEGLEQVPAADVELRARLLARLAGVLRDEHRGERRDRLSREAVELARSTGNPAALAFALDGRLAAISAPDTIDESLVLVEELRAVAERIGDPERVANALDHKRTRQLMAGGLREAELALATDSAFFVDLRQPAQQWQVLAARALFALAAGRLAEAQALVPQALAVGEEAMPEVAVPVHRLQLHALCDLQGRLAEVLPAVDDLAATHTTRPAFRCALACLQARLGLLPEARRALAELVEDEVAALPFDQEWLYGASLLAETASLLEDAEAAAVLYRVLEPWAACSAADNPEGFRGSMARYLGLLATTAGRWTDAERHFEDALAANARMGARPWEAHTASDWARTLRARGGRGDRDRARVLSESALSTYRELGMEAYVAEIAAVGP